MLTKNLVENLGFLRKEGRDGWGHGLGKFCKGKNINKKVKLCINQKFREEKKQKYEYEINLCTGWFVLLLTEPVRTRG